MRVAIDARELLGQPTGVGRYLSGILDAWETLPSAAAHDFVLCAPEPVDTALLRAGRASTTVAGGHGTWWEQTALPRLVRRTRADVLFAPGYSGPLFCPSPVVVAIHDVSFAAHPEWFSPREGLRRRAITRLSARRAARVLTISEFSKREIVARLGVHAKKIDVVYPGITMADDDSRGSPRQGPPTVLYVGSLFTRRHIPELISGFAALARRTADVRLELVGDNRTTPRVDFDRVVANSGIVDRIRLRSFVSDQELGALYRSARAFVFLSEYEGFGLTPLEALAAGIPIVVLDTPVAREVYDDAALYVRRPDPVLIEAALERILTDQAERIRIVAAGRAVLARYSWCACAEQVLDVLVRASTCRDSR
jgi:glycosyltransferase involved in cell wall biosynthesis